MTEGKEEEIWGRSWQCYWGSHSGSRRNAFSLQEGVGSQGAWLAFSPCLSVWAPSIWGERRMSEACQLICERGQGPASYSWWPVLCSPQAKNGLYIFKGLFFFLNVIETTCPSEPKLFINLVLYRKSLL